LNPILFLYTLINLKIQPYSRPFLSRPCHDMQS